MSQLADLTCHSRFVIYFIVCCERAVDCKPVWQKMASIWKLHCKKSHLKNPLESACELIACHSWPFKTNNYVFCWLHFVWYNYSQEIHKSSLCKSKTRFKAYIVVQDAEGSLSMPSTKQQDNKKHCVVLLEPGSFGKK